MLPWNTAVSWFLGMTPPLGPVINTILMKLMKRSPFGHRPRVSGLGLDYEINLIGFANLPQKIDLLTRSLEVHRCTAPLRRLCVRNQRHSP